jgi:hypothetical protein
MLVTLAADDVVSGPGIVKVCPAFKTAEVTRFEYASFRPTLRASYAIVVVIDVTGTYLTLLW